MLERAWAAASVDAPAMTALGNRFLVCTIVALTGGSSQRE